MTTDMTPTTVRRFGERERFGYTMRPVVVKWGPVTGWEYITLVPAGLRAVWLADPGPAGGRWVLDEFPPYTFPPHDFSRHDAEHYGLPLPADAIEEA